MSRSSYSQYVNIVKNNFKRNNIEKSILYKMNNKITFCYIQQPDHPLLK